MGIVSGTAEIIGAARPLQRSPTLHLGVEEPLKTMNRRAFMELDAVATDAWTGICVPLHGPRTAVESAGQSGEMVLTLHLVPMRI